MRLWWRAQVAEIAASRELRFYGVALSLVHVLTLFFWRGGVSLTRYLDDPITICWPMLSACRSWHWLWEMMLGPVTWAYIIVTAIATLAWFGRSTRTAYGLLLVATALKFLLYSLDYREMGNYHYMPAVITLLFLFAPRKSEVMRFMIVGFYLGAGVLKFNEEWLSGSAIFGHPLLTGRWLVLGCAAVIGLEMVISLGLLARERVVQYPALVAFAIFHLFSWHIVGFFYPLVMFALLSIFVLVRSFDERATSLGDFFAGRCGRSTYVLLGAFALMQLPPVFSRTDSALTGEKRLTSLNMFDARIQCFAHVLGERDVDGVRTTMDINDPVPGLGTRIHCEPWVYAEYARSLCAQARGDETLRGIRIKLLAKRSSGKEWVTTLDREDRCGRTESRSIHDGFNQHRDIIVDDCLGEVFGRNLKFVGSSDHGAEKILASRLAFDVK